METITIVTVDDHPLIRQAIRSLIDERENMELIGEGSLAFELFTYTLTLTPKAGGDPIKDSGRCFWLWRREDRDWKVARAMWNSPQPLPGA